MLDQRCTSTSCALTQIPFRFEVLQTEANRLTKMWKTTENHLQKAIAAFQSAKQLHKEFDKSCQAIKDDALSSMNAVCFGSTLMGTTLETLPMSTIKQTELVEVETGEQYGWSFSPTARCSLPNGFYLTQALFGGEERDILKCLNKVGFSDLCSDFDPRYEKAPTSLPNHTESVLSFRCPSSLLRKYFFDPCEIHNRSPLFKQRLDGSLILPLLSVFFVSPSFLFLFRTPLFFFPF